MKANTSLLGSVTSVLCAVFLASCCFFPPPAPPPPAPAPPPPPEVKFTARVTCDVSTATVMLNDVPMGLAPQDIGLASGDDVVGISGVFGEEKPVETRVRFLSAEQAEVTLLFNSARSAMVKALGLPRIVVFDYGAGLTFDVSKFDLKPEFLPLLDRQADILQRHFPSVPVYVCGHTDSSGGDEQNLKLSVERSQAVTDYLVSKGVPKDLVKTQGFGSAFPVAGNDTPDGRARNRRTEVILPR